MSSTTNTTVDGRGLDTSRIKKDFDTGGFIRCWSVFKRIVGSNREFDRTRP